MLTITKASVQGNVSNIHICKLKQSFCFFGPKTYHVLDDGGACDFFEKAVNVSVIQTVRCGNISEFQIFVTVLIQIFDYFSH